MFVLAKRHPRAGRKAPWGGYRLIVIVNDLLTRKVGRKTLNDPINTTTTTGSLTFNIFSESAQAYLLSHVCCGPRASRGDATLRGCCRKPERLANMGNDCRWDLIRIWEVVQSLKALGQYGSAKKVL